MARSFTTASSQYLENTSTPPVGFTGCSLVCWATRSVDVVESALINVGINTTVGTFVGLYMNSDGRARAYSYAAATGVSAFAGTGGGAINTWNFYGATFTSSTLRNAYWNTASGSNTTSNAPTGTLTGMSIGRAMRTTRNYHGGLIAEAAVYDAVLTAAEMLQLANKVSPLLVARQNLVAYWPLLGAYSPEIDVRGGYNMTLNASPTEAAHVPIIYSLPSQILKLTTATITGTAAQTITKAQQSASALETITGTAAQTITKAAQVLTALETVFGSAAQAIPIAQQSASATETITGTVGQTISIVSQSAAALETLTGTAAQVAPSAQQAASGTETITGSILQTAPVSQQSVSALETITGTVSQVAPSAGQSATGTAADSAPYFTGWVDDDDDSEWDGYRKKKKKKGKKSKKHPKPSIVSFLEVYQALKKQDDAQSAAPEIAPDTLPMPPKKAIERKAEQVAQLPLGPSLEQLDGLLAAIELIQAQILLEAQQRAALEEAARLAHERQLLEMWAQTRLEALAMQMHIDAELERLQLEEDETVVQLLHEFMMQ